jgi:OOP family OmpA-OmpF porin
MQNRLLAAGLLLLAGALPAHANDWYVYGAISQSNVVLDKGALDTTLTNHGATGLSSDKSGTDNQWRLQLGYWFSPYFAIEGGYIDLGKASYTANYTGGSASADWKSGGIDLAALGTLDVDWGFSVIGKAGLINTKTTTTWSNTGLTGMPVGDVNKTQIRPFIGIGAGYELTPKSLLRLEFERFFKVGEAGTTGQGEINTFSLGASYNF